MPKKVFVTDNNVAGKFFIYFSCKVTQRNYKIVTNMLQCWKGWNIICIIYQLLVETVDIDADKIDSLPQANPDIVNNENGGFG